ncbi:UDP-N-acetylmuramate--L-alanine ligase [Roseivirga sp. BDSF3-8]|uniref:UDP-N-acetylmuramate--L-alanine ligase n=1 Tax=Roseivirga sp. BDSF3-8 TaxID=3241598 RepID=UPI0035318BF1
MEENSQKVHFIAIGGSVMHNLAIALMEMGHEVSGSDDLFFDPSRSRLEEYGLLPEQEGWQPEKITSDLDAVILGMHAKEDNPELLKAREVGVPVYSFPEYVYEQSKDKQRIVIAGSHGKTTITSMVMHVLRFHKQEFDYLVGASLEGFPNSVKISDAPIIIIEGDEYLSSPIDPTPKFLKYQHHIGLISGISWDHINVFPNVDNYVRQFDLFADATPKAGVIIYCEEDPMATVIGNKEREDVTKIEYKSHAHKIKEGVTYLQTDSGEVPLQVFGHHNMQNISAAKKVCKRIGITGTQFYQAIRTFKGASKRMELVDNNGSVAIYKDYAHSPSKLDATTKALKAQYPDRTLFACIELHTFSSLNPDFLKTYQNTFNETDVPMVYVNPDTVAHKKLALFTEAEIREAFGRDDVRYFTDTNELEKFLTNEKWNDKNLLMMSSGSFNGLDLKELSQKILNN